MAIDRVVIVTKPTRFQDLVREHLTEGTAEFVLASRGQSIEPYRDEDRVYEQSLKEVHRQIPNDLPVTSVSREMLPNFLFRDNDLIVVSGPDGLFANLAQYVSNQPILTVNPDPLTIAGKLMLFKPEHVGGMIDLVRTETYRSERLPFVKATIDNDVTIFGINDIFIGRRDHISARYGISFHNRQERHSSSGIIVSTGLGSTGWLSSIAAMVSGIVPQGTRHDLSQLPEATTNQLVFVVREPFLSPTTQAGIVTGRIIPGRPLVVDSEMPDGGYLFSDGVVEKAIEWNAGSQVTVSVGERYVQRIIR